MRKLILLVLVLYSTVTLAQESQYEEMKRTMNENSLPLVNMTVDITTVNSTDFTAGEIEIADYLRRTDPDTETVRYRCKYRIRGGMASRFDKKSFAVKLYDEYDEDLDANIFGIREENSWILDAMAVDRIRMRNRVCFDVWNEMSHTPYDTKHERRNGTKGVFVELFINGQYHGLYCMTDKIDRKLLGLKKVKADGDGKVMIRGLLYKGEQWNDFTDIWLRSYSEADTSKDTWNAWELQYPDEYPSTDTWQPIMDLIDFCSSSTSDEEFIQDYQNYFYVENLADYAVFTMALNVGDNAYKNTFLSTVDITKGHRYLLTPWDMDQSLGGLYNGDYNNTFASINQYNNIAPYNRLVVQDINGFKDLEADKWASYHTTLFSCENLCRRLDKYAGLFAVSGAWERECEKWNGNPVPLKESVADELEYVKEWYRENYENLCAQFGIVITGVMNQEQRLSPSHGIYTIEGSRINRKILHKGVYIVDGKKVVIR